ncbi:MAG TPA: peptidoglycan DD-metalloendopeptidase family protein [Thermoanaerobaculia bacterium]|nr:peptidoglycan DD-metalloendopeptidase family protein [Thermoanaerobaculia bacterium]
MRKLLAAFVAALLILTAAHSQSIKDADLERIRNEIVRLKKRLENVRSQTRSAEQDLEASEIELEIRTHELQIAIDLQQRLEDEQRVIQEQIASLTPKIEEQKRFLRKRLVVLYRLGSLSYLRLLLSIGEHRDSLETMSMLSYLVGRDARAISHFEEARRQLSLRTAELADRQRRIADMRRVVEERRTAVARSAAEKQHLLAALRSEGSKSEQKIADLEERAKRLERLVAILAAKTPAAMPGADDIRTFQGALSWPAAGKVVESFGRQRNPKFSTETISNGLKIAAAPGVPVQAVFQGTVLFSQWFKGYGNLIILDHGNRVFSLYGNVKSPGINVGDRVATGQAIAGVGEGEDAQIGYVYFEIRQDNRPEDPQKWLR